ncbi:MAG: arginine repressor [Myxococcota bacterium]
MNLRPSPPPSPRGRGSSRHAAIRELIRSRQVGTQEELRLLLAKEGFEVTQATLSRDLARLGARRVALPEGGTTYELEERAGPTPDALAALRDMVTSVTHTGALVVIHTLPGAASAVALTIDRARLSQIAGTIAGDDTIFIAPARGVAPGRVSRHLEALWRKGGLQ